MNVFVVIMKARFNSKATLWLCLNYGTPKDQSENTRCVLFKLCKWFERRSHITSRQSVIARLSVHVVLRRTVSGDIEFDRGFDNLSGSLKL